MKHIRTQSSVPMSFLLRPVSAVRSLGFGVVGVLRTWPLFWSLLLGVGALFLLMGAGSFSTTSRSVLHGLCAQRPTHSFTIGGELLPFDARMTGIYSGAIWSWVVFSVRRRLLAAVTPRLPVLLILAGAVAVMGIDGFNALLVDLGSWHPYEPHNLVRFFTGFGTGVAIASLQVWLIGGSLFKLARNSRSWDSVRELWWTVPVSMGAIALIWIDQGWMYPVIASMLIASAWITVTGLMLVVIVSLLRAEARIVSPRGLEAPLIVSAVAALFVILGLAQFRFWLERSLGIPQDFLATALQAHPSILLEMFGKIFPR